MRKIHSQRSRYITPATVNKRYFFFTLLGSFRVTRRSPFHHLIYNKTLIEITTKTLTNYKDLHPWNVHVTLSDPKSFNNIGKSV